MSKIATMLMGAVIVSAGLVAASAPASALGACGPNRHRNHWGQCVWGGQNQASCLRRTGHLATPGPNGTLWCQRY